MTPDPLTPADLDWTDAGAPVSRVFGDVYFSREDGLAETRAVFLEGCGLPDAWAGRRHFVVGELGFGTGLNILALLELWSRTRPPGGYLNIWSVEAHPLTRAAASAAHAAWPQLTLFSQMLLDRWPAPVPGLHRIDFPSLGATLDLWLGDAAAGLRQWAGKADAWFLDGFAPSTNPAMWSSEVLGFVADRSAPGARVATFTVAGHVRRSLADHGFAVEKKPGHGRKRERLEARLSGAAADTTPVDRVAIVGAGIAGASVARALRCLGVATTLFDDEGAGAGASGAPAALVTPWVDAGLSDAAVLAAQAFHRAVTLYRAETPDALLHQGVIRSPKDPADLARLLQVARQPIWPQGAMVELAAEASAARLGEAEAQTSVWLEEALVIEPRAVLDTWLADQMVDRRRVARIMPGSPAQLIFEDGTSAAFDHVVVAAGWGAEALVDAPLSPVRGQLAWVDGVEAIAPSIWGPGYAIPTRQGVLVGATHDRGRTDIETSVGESEALLTRLEQARPRLSRALQGAEIKSRAAVRATTSDHRPLCGRWAQGIWILSGLGGRGFSWAPMLGEHLAAEMTATPSPVSRDHHRLVDARRLSGQGR